VEGIMGASFCLVSAWLGKKLIEWMIPEMLSKKVNYSNDDVYIKHKRRGNS